ncbi:hypothetical protein EPO04_03955 [Patescibacteria group bacterium]|nr:MAG: hypothetical protein EPO04_03955 [Patescibacteria group bacterium]
MPHDEELDRLRTEMNGAWEAKEYARRQHDDAWDEVQSVQSRNGYRIESLRAEHDRKFDQMKAAYDAASNAFLNGDHDEAARKSAEGRSLRAELPSLVSERRSLVEECKAAQRGLEATRDVLKDKKHQFRLAKERFDDRKAVLEASRRDVAFKAGVQHYGHDVKVVHKDNKTHVYFGGVGRPDGAGHAHYVLDEFGNIEYRRDPFQERGPHNFR